MFFINAEYLDDDFKLQKGDIRVESGIIVDIGEKLSYKQSDMVIDCEDFKIVPGFVDIHIHGCVMADASDGDYQKVLEMADFLVQKGVTSFCPTTMAMPLEDIEKAVSEIKKAKLKQESGATIQGINLEGPFISKEKKGAQKEESIIPPDIEIYKKLQKLSGNLIKIVDMAPETKGAKEFIEEAKKDTVVSIAHTTADFDTATKSFKYGISHATHLFNAMTGFSHREPGTVGAIFDCKDVTAEIVCDGKHIHKSAVRTAFKLLKGRIAVVSDAMRLCGEEDGQTGDLGGQEVTVKNGKAVLPDGTIAGSATNLHEELKNLISWGIPFGEAIKAMTLTPAKIIGKDFEIGSLTISKKADIVILDKNYDIVAVYH